MLSGSPGCRSLSFPTSFCHAWHWFNRLHSAIAITNQTSANAVLCRTLRSSLTTADSLARSSGSLLWDTPGSASSSRLVHTPCHRCPYHVTCTSESSLVFCFLVVCQIRSFPVFFFPLLALSEMYWPLRPPCKGLQRRQVSRLARQVV